MGCLRHVIFNIVVLHNNTNILQHCVVISNYKIFSSPFRDEETLHDGEIEQTEAAAAVEMPRKSAYTHRDNQQNVCNACLCARVALKVSTRKVTAVSRATKKFKYR